MREVTILATGFSVFPGAPENPTAWAIGELERSGWRPEGARLLTHTFDVRFDLWERQAQPLIAKAKPDAFVAFGLSAKATGVTLESTARNSVAVDRPDFAGACASASCVIDEAPAVHPTRLPLAAISGALRSANMPLAHSDDAGDYLCNLLFYRLMHVGPRVAGFVHVPYLDTQLARLRAAGHTLSAASTLTEEQLLTAVKTIIECCARAAHEGAVA